MGPNASKVAALAEMPIPTYIKQLRSLLRGLSFYRKFLPSLAKQFRPLNFLLKKGAKFEFTLKKENAVHALIAKLSEDPFWLSLIGLLQMTVHVPSGYATTLASMVLVPLSSKNKRTVLLAPFFTSAGIRFQ